MNTTLPTALTAALLLSLTGNPAGADTGVNAPPNLGTTRGGEVQSPDLGTHGQPITDSCAEDIDNDGTIDFQDLVGVLEAWGRCPYEQIGDPLGTGGKFAAAPCPADINHDGYVDFGDVQLVLIRFGLDCDFSSTP